MSANKSSTKITTGPDGEALFDGMSVQELIASLEMGASSMSGVTAAALRHLSAQNEWQPIETAPHDKEIFAGYFKDGKFKADLTYWNNGHWWQMTQNIPTHWRPLPAPPGDEK